MNIILSSSFPIQVGTVKRSIRVPIPGKDLFYKAKKETGGCFIP